MKAFIAAICATMGVGMSVVSGACAAEGWIEDFEQGMAAAADGRTALVEFTGTDWCHYCIVLQKNVFPSQEFADFVKENNLVLVELDFPHGPDKITPEQRAKNEEIGRRYNVQGYPTILVMDADRQPYARVVGGAESAQAYIARLKAALEVKKACEGKLAEASELSGPERLAALKEVMAMVPMDCRWYQTKLIDQIIESDPEDTTGLRKRRDSANLQERQIEDMKRAITESTNGRGVAAALPEVRAALAKQLERTDLLPFVRLSVNAFISQSYVGEGNFVEALKYMDAAIAAAPDTKEAEVMRNGRKELEALISHSRNQKEQ